MHVWSAHLDLGKHASVFARSIMEYSGNNNRITEIVKNGIKSDDHYICHMLIRMPSHEGMEWNESACHEECGFPEISLWEDKSLTRHPTFSENTREAELQAFYELLTMLRHRGPIRLGTVDPGCRYQNPRQTITRRPRTQAC